MEEYFPAVQSMHAVAIVEALLYFPAMQLAQKVAPEFELLPALQLIQDVIPNKTENLPGVHKVQFLWSPLPMEPGLHDMHALTDELK